MGLQLRHRGEEGRPGQRGSREVGRGAVHLFVAPEIKGDLFADGGRPGPPFMLDGCEVGQRTHKGQGIVSERENCLLIKKQLISIH